MKKCALESSENALAFIDRKKETYDRILLFIGDLQRQFGMFGKAEATFLSVRRDRHNRERINFELLLIKNEDSAVHYLDEYKTGGK